jgi:hypothetical protein
MAKKIRTKKKVKKNIANGVVHIQSTLMLWPGRVPAFRVLKDLVKALLLRLNWRLKMPPRKPKNTG